MYDLMSSNDQYLSPDWNSEAPSSRLFGVFRLVIGYVWPSPSHLKLPSMPNAVKVLGGAHSGLYQVLN
jgi:hypothetical protein